jgi:hypothetical protein
MFVSADEIRGEGGIFVLPSKRLFEETTSAICYCPSGIAFS